jgi:hypothetical protein
MHLLGQSGRFIGVKFAHSDIEVGASVPELATGTVLGSWSLRYNRE